MIGIVCRVKVICRKGRKNLRYTHNSNRKIITVLEYIYTFKYILLPLIVTKKSYYYARNYIKGQKLPEAVYTYSFKS